MLRELATSTIDHLPFLVALVLGGMTGNAIADRKIAVHGFVYAVVALIFVISLVGSSYYLEEGPRLYMLLFNALSGACLSFALTVGGDFAEPQRVPARVGSRSG
jgi:cyanate permease